MFINGQWQWVANTQDVIDAKSELADAEYARKTANATLTQTNSLNALTAQQNELGTVINEFENGIIDLDTAIYRAEQAMQTIPSAIKDIFSSIKFAASNSTTSNDNPAGYVITYRPSSKSSVLTSKIETEGDVNYKPFANGSKFTPLGSALMGEDGEEWFIKSSGHLIPVNQPTFGNIDSGGIVFNQNQMANLRSLWDLSNIGLSGYSNLINTSMPQNIDNSNCNNVIINGLTVDSGSQEGQALINALRRFVAIH